MINIIDCGVTEITHEGKTVKLPNELILFAADEIREKFKTNNESLEERIDQIEKTLIPLMEWHTQSLDNG